ncbi:butyryl-CoA:acetoacetate CoA-transferase beta subunit [Sporobacter termitidis DSM 10068]|uniref:Butyryl-CoA:acetoacetate CoA-transferase beta subunit n=1 Tax=Sporobacter termitidis DSM 10068 TaxID=1123282 RepID=A0A1M5ZFX2_9FIRM|nr:3-oxoacid CoA-transferase subunit B [Sporobacter termitidis]SHI23156.1 butyryl-CoA:acetoacetate CoA-transferase beta subunit [Sporobacter termitidis DSM 10068]
MDTKNFIAKRVAKELKDGDVVNLGIGLPTLVANYVPEGIQITLQAEHGILGSGPAAKPGEEDPEIINAGGFPITVLPGACFFDSSTSFGIIRGGHVDVTILGALQVDEKGNIANWMVPGKRVPGMGGAMDLVVGAKEVIVAMEHAIKGEPKIMKTCTYPLTAVGVVKKIITEMGVMDITKDGIVLTEVAPGFTAEDVQAVTDAKLIVPNNLAVMEI